MLLVSDTFGGNEFFKSVGPDWTSHAVLYTRTCSKGIPPYVPRPSPPAKHTLLRTTKKKALKIGVEGFETGNGSAIPLSPPPSLLRQNKQKIPRRSNRCAAAAIPAIAAAPYPPLLLLEASS